MASRSRRALHGPALRFVVTALAIGSHLVEKSKGKFPLSRCRVFRRTPLALHPMGPGPARDA
jgi:hypothetical protein